MTNTQIAPVPAVERSAAVPVPCRQVPLSALPGVPRSMMAYCPLLTELSTEDLLGQFKAAPQFDKIHPDRLLSHCRGNLEVILLTESDYYARQAAVYLATLRAQTQQFQSCSTEDDYWCDITDLLDQVPAEESPEDALERALTVLSPALLDPSIQSGSEKRRDMP